MKKTIDIQSADFQDKLRRMLELQLENDRQVHAYKQLNYDEIIGKYFYAFLENISNANYKGKERWCWWRTIPENKRLWIEQRASFVFTTQTILSYLLALSAGDIAVIMHYLPTEKEELGNYWKEHTPYKMYLVNLLNEFACPQKAEIGEIFKNWIALIEFCNYDFTKDVYNLYVEFRESHNYSKPGPLNAKSRKRRHQYKTYGNQKTNPLEKPV